MSDNRTPNRFDKIKSHYDLIVVGGGIYGATVAWEAVSRGLSVLLMEKHDFGSGTSANSLKTIHGGLRSLQRMDFKGMREYIHERRALMRIAPHLVEPLKCIIPTFSKLGKSKLFMWAGINVYDLISFDRNRGLDDAHKIPPCEILPRGIFEAMAPELDDTNMTGAACWHDAQVYNSERLVLSFVLTAARAGADVFNYLSKKSYQIEDNKITGIIAVDELNNEELSLQASTVVDCTGPWAAHDDFFRDLLPDRHPPVMARAVNLVINRKLSSCGLGVSSKGNSRLLFIVPWREGSIVGTWYYPDTSSPEYLSLTEMELLDCLNQINSVFPDSNVTKQDVTLVHRGLQPAELNNISCAEPKLWTESRIFDSSSGSIPNGLYWILGVKLTTARNTAVELVNSVAKNHDFTCKLSSTHNSALYGGEIPDIELFLSACKKQLSTQFSDETISRLVKNYGSNIQSIINLIEMDSSLALYVPGCSDTIRAELKYVLDNEFPVRLTDLLLRRTDIGSFKIPEFKTIDYCAGVMADYYDWDEIILKKNINALLQYYPSWCIKQQTGLY